MSSLHLTQATRSSRAVASSMTILALAAGLGAMSASQADARGFPRGGGGLPAGRIGAMQRPTLPAGRQPTAIANKPRLGDAAQRPAAAHNGNRAGAAANGSGNARVDRNGNSGVVGNTANSGTIGSGNGNTGVVNHGNVGNGNVNTGNVVAGNNVNVDVDGGGAYPGGAYATGVAVGTATSAAIASAYHSTLPAGCYSYGWSAVQYYQCAGGTWYQRQYQGGSTVYVTVADPTKTK